MKKLLTLLIAFCAVFAVSSAAFAETNLQANIEQALDKAPAMVKNFENKIKATITVIYQTQDESIDMQTGQEHTDFVNHIAVCSTVIFDDRGGLAIDKSCASHLFPTDPHASVNIFVNLKNLGQYNNGDDFFYEAENVSQGLFAKKENFITFPLALKQNSAVKATLTKLFEQQKIKQLPEIKIVQMLKSMPKKKAHNEIVSGH